MLLCLWFGVPLVWGVSGFGSLTRVQLRSKTGNVKAQLKKVHFASKLGHVALIDLRRSFPTSFMWLLAGLRALLAIG